MSASATEASRRKSNLCESALSPMIVMLPRPAAWRVMSSRQLLDGNHVSGVQFGHSARGVLRQ